MSKRKILVLLALQVVFLIGCLDNVNPKDLVEAQETDTITFKIDSTWTDSTFHCDSASNATPFGTSCCISGPTKVKPGAIVKYQYQINHQNPCANWVIQEGEITIIEGQDSRTVTVEFGVNFTNGIIRSLGVGYKNGTPLICNDRISISRE